MRMRICRRSFGDNTRPLPSSPAPVSRCAGVAPAPAPAAAAAAFCFSAPENFSTADMDVVAVDHAFCARRRASSDIDAKSARSAGVGYFGYFGKYSYSKKSGLKAFWILSEKGLNQFKS